jgi:hypothetical protein
LFLLHAAGEKTGHVAKTGDIVSVTFDKSKRTLEWRLNDTLLSSTFHVVEPELYPAVSIQGEGNAVELLDFDSFWI